VARTGHRRGAHRFPVWSPEGNRPLGRTKGRRKNIKMTLHGGEWGGRMDWIDLAQNKARWRVIVNVIINFRIP
jgi:hypothetical protein